MHDPFPLPVHWHDASSFLTDRPKNIQRLPPGADPPRLDLGGDLRNVAEVYGRIPSGRLIVLGWAGSGKSILTIRFVLDFLETRAPLDRVPVIFSVGSWDPTAIALRDWLIDQLVRDHPHLTRRTPGGSTMAAALVDADLVLPVLDGFDEIAEVLRGWALRVLNTTSFPLVMTSRPGEFAEAVREAGRPLVRAAGIELRDLTLDDRAVYLSRTARPVARGHGHSGSGALWDGVLEQLRAGGTGFDLAWVLSTPLMITLARTMYSEAPGRDPMELLDTVRFPDARSLEEHLLAGLVPTVYQRGAAEPTTFGRRERNRAPERAERWLGYLAHNLDRLNSQRKGLAWKGLAWWEFGDSLRRSTRVMTVGVTSTLCVAASVWLGGLFFTSLAFDEVLLLGGLMGPAAGLAFGLAYGVMPAFGGAAFVPNRVRLRSRTGIGRRLVLACTAQLRAVLLGGFMMGVACAGALALQCGLDRGFEITNDVTVTGTLVGMVAFGLSFGAGTGLVFVFLAVLAAPAEIAYATTPASLLASSRATVVQQVLVLVSVLSLTIFLAGQLLANPLQSLFGSMHWSLSDGLAIGAAGGLGGTCAYALSFTAWGRWLVLSRVWLPLTGKLPWDIVAFLDDACRQGVLRRTGAVYHFRHPTLQHHFERSFRQATLQDHSERSLRQATLQDRLRRLFRRPQVNYPPVRFLGDSLYTQHDTARRHRMAVVLVLCCLAVFLTVGLLSVHDLLDSWSQHGRLLPGDTTAVVGSIIGIGGALGTLIGATLTAFARLVQARGQAHADRIRAEAELLRAEAEMHRARTGQIPGPTPTPEASPDSGSTTTAE
ncbi:NACHT domain-containing protein [Streptomyces scopuliridis]|uniref:NACHT domain-containing protein n=1 Tax=Streptomyces scopuliridis TaxID=452529 RepID=UPI0036B72FBF